MTVRLVTDSTADIPQDQAQAAGITVVPLTVFFGDEAYLDGVELDNASFYSKLQASKELPRTSQPSPATSLHVPRGTHCPTPLKKFLLNLSIRKI